jgi:hypothetical protein
MASEQCDWTNMAGRRCAYVAGHSGEHLYPQHNEDLSHEIRLRNAQDVRDREIATLRRDADARDAEIAGLRACLRTAIDAFDRGTPMISADYARIRAALGETEPTTAGEGVC